MSDVNKQLLDALEKISRMTMSMYANAGEAMRDAKRIAYEAIAAAKQAQQADPRCACGDSFTSDAVCANCLCTQTAAVPDGCALVPAVATDHMTWVGQSMRYDREISIGAIYAAMLAAAPKP